MAAKQSTWSAGTRQRSMRRQTPEAENQMNELAATRLRTFGPRLGNSALPNPLTLTEQNSMVEAATVKIAELLSILEVDHRLDHNTRDTPGRVAKMFVHEVMKGRFTR